MLFVSLALPPSLNTAYPSSKSGRRFKSKKMKDWELEIEAWILCHFQKVRHAREYFKDIPTGKFLKVELDFHFERSQVISKEGKPKTIDLDNRIKFALDALSKIIGLDDKYVWEIKARKWFIMSGKSSFNVEVDWADTHVGNGSTR